MERDNVKICTTPTPAPTPAPTPFTNKECCPTIISNVVTYDDQCTKQYDDEQIKKIVGTPWNRFGNKNNDSDTNYGCGQIQCGDGQYYYSPTPWDDDKATACCVGGADPINSDDPEGEKQGCKNPKTN